MKYRSLLSDAKILALDEATANVDRTTDAMIQQSLRFVVAQGRRTLLVIAHRIDTVIDCDLLLVLDDGKLVEFDKPEVLLKSGGIFAEMVEATKKAATR